MGTLCFCMTRRPRCAEALAGGGGAADAVGTDGVDVGADAALPDFPCPRLGAKLQTYTCHDNKK
jgi:hypothetical protein